MTSYGVIWWLVSLFLFLIRLARTANLIVERVSGRSLRSKEQVVTIVVLHPPLRESLRIRVNLELR